MQGHVEAATSTLELLGLGGHALLQRSILGQALLGRKVAHLLRDLHGTELGPAHGAEMRHLGAVLGQGLVVVLLRRLGVQAQVELVLPAEVETRLAQRVVTRAGTGVALGHIGGVRGDLVGDDALLDVIAVGQAQVLLGRDVAQHGRAHPADHGGTDGAGNVVVARRDVDGQRAQS